MSRSSDEPVAHAPDEPVSPESDGPISLSSPGPVSRESDGPISHISGEPVAEESDGPISLSWREPVSRKSDGPVSRETANVRVAPQSPFGAAQIFGERLSLAEQFTAILTDSGVSHGLIGPREVPRLWERHVLNCAVIHPAIAQGQVVIDVGSGAGLPGLALAIARPDLEIHCVEPMLRRTTWLSVAVAELNLTNVTVHRGRAEQFWGILSAPVVTARAVARLGELAKWCLPLVQPGGCLLAIRGASAAEELDAERPALRRLGAVEEVIETFGEGVVDPQTTVLRIIMGKRPVPGAGSKKSRARAKRRGAAPASTV